MADERSPLLQDGRQHDSGIDYSAVNDPVSEQADSVSIHASEATHAEQQETVVAPQNSVITLVRFGKYIYMYLILTLALLLDEGDTNGDRDILNCNGSNDYRGLCVTYSFTLLNLESQKKVVSDSICFYWKRVE